MKKLLLILILAVFTLSSSYSQESINAAGGDAEGNGGSMSYSVGQVFYEYLKTEDIGSVLPGVQQPYEISVVTGIFGVDNISLLFSAFPNPFTDLLTLRVDKDDLKNLSFQIFDLNGRLVKIGNITDIETIINMSEKIPGVYILKVTDNYKDLITFKIIKN